jgi:hypothetical protein
MHAFADDTTGPSGTTVGDGGVLLFTNITLASGVSLNPQSQVIVLETGVYLVTVQAFMNLPPEEGSLFIDNLGGVVVPENCDAYVPAISPYMVNHTFLVQATTANAMFSVRWRSTIPERNFGATPNLPPSQQTTITVARIG